MMKMMMMMMMMMMMKMRQIAEVTSESECKPADMSTRCQSQLLP